MTTLTNKTELAKRAASHMAPQRQGHVWPAFDRDLDGKSLLFVGFRCSLYNYIAENLEYSRSASRYVRKVKAKDVWSALAHLGAKPRDFPILEDRFAEQFDVPVDIAVAELSDSPLDGRLVFAVKVKDQSEIRIFTPNDWVNEACEQSTDETLSYLCQPFDVELIGPPGCECISIDDIESNPELFEHDPETGWVRSIEHGNAIVEAVY